MTWGHDADVSHKQRSDGRAEDTDIGGTAVTTKLIAVEAVRSGGRSRSMGGGGGGHGSETLEITRRKIGRKTQLGYARACRKRGGWLHCVEKRVLPWCSFLFAYFVE